MPKGHTLEVSRVLGILFLQCFFNIQVTLLKKFPINIPELWAGNKGVTITLKYLVHVISSHFFILKSLKNI